MRIVTQTRREGKRKRRRRRRRREKRAGPLYFPRILEGAGEKLLKDPEKGEEVLEDDRGESELPDTRS